MIDFRKKIAVGTAIVKTNPIEIYDIQVSQVKKYSF